MKINFLCGIIVPWCVLVLLSGCASNLAQDKVKDELSSTKGSIEIPPPVPSKLSLYPILEAEQSKEKLYSFSAKDIALEDALYRLTKEAGINIIWNEGVDPKTKISVSFEDMTFLEALDIIFAPTNYLYSTNSPTLYIKLVDTRVFELEHIPNKINSQVQVGGNVLGSIPNAGGMSGQVQITGTTDVDAVDFWKQIEEGMKKLVSADGQYFINKLAGMVTVTDHKQNLKLVENFIARVKSTMNRQVLIEAEVVEVTLERAQSWGIDWSAVHSFLLNDKNIELKASQNLGLPGSVVQLSASRSDASAIIDVLNRFGKVNVLSKPRLTVMNGQTAMINVGQVMSYWELTGVAGGSETGQPIVVPEQKTVLLGLTMGVTPFISSEDYIIMQVVPIVSDASTWSEFQYNNQTLKAPNVDIRETSTQVGVKDGETVVIGGLITSKLTDTEHKVPVLGDIPLLGYFFKRKESTEQKSELVIFLTCRITTLDKKEG